MRGKPAAILLAGIGGLACAVFALVSWGITLGRSAENDPAPWWVYVAFGGPALLALAFLIGMYNGDAHD